MKSDPGSHALNFVKFTELCKMGSKAIMVGEAIINATTFVGGS